MAGDNVYPVSISNFFMRLKQHPDYECRAGQMQLMVYFRGKKVGGLNQREKHWYFSKVFVRAHAAADHLTAHGFKHVIHNDKHDYWRVDGLGMLPSFEEAMVAMTGVRP